MVFPKRVFRVVAGPRNLHYLKFALDITVWLPMIQRSVFDMLIGLIAHFHLMDVLFSVFRLHPGPPSVPQREENSTS